MSELYTDEEWAAIQPIYTNRRSQIGACIMVGTYLVFAGLLALNGYILRKLWHHDKGGEKMKDAKDAGGHDEFIG